MGAPRVTHRDPHIVQLFNLFADYIDNLGFGGTTTPVTMTNVLRVDKGGSDATGQRNNFAKPFLTIQAAVTAAQDNDLILIGPGTFAEQVTVPATIGLSFLGSGSTETRIDFAAQALIWNPTADKNLIVSRIGLPTGGIIITAGVGTVGVNGVIALKDLILPSGPTPGIELHRLNRAFISDCFGDVGGTSLVSVNNCAHVFLDGGDRVSANSTFDVTVAAPTSPGRELVISNASLVGVTHTKVSEVRISNSRVQNGIVSNVQDDPVSGVKGALFGSDSYVGNLDISAAYSTVLTPAYAADIARCGVANIVTNATASTISRVGVRARNSTIDATTTISAGAKVDLDLRGSDFSQALLSVVGSGRINRSMYAFTPAAPIGAVPGPVTIPIPYMDSNYSTSFEFDSPNQSVYLVPASKSPGSFNAGGIVAGVPGAVAPDIMILQQ